MTTAIKTVPEAGRAGFQSLLRPLEGNACALSAAITGGGGLLTAINLASVDGPPTFPTDVSLYASGSGGKVVGLGRSLDARTALELGFLCGHASVSGKVAQVLIALVKPTVDPTLFIRTPVWRGEIVASASQVSSKVMKHYVRESDQSKFAQASWANNFTASFNEALSPGVISVGKGGTGAMTIVIDTSGATHVELYANCTTADGSARSLEAIAPVFANW